MTRREPPNLILLLYSDPADAVVRALTGQATRLPCELLAMSLSQLVDEALPGEMWKWAGRVIDPARSAVVNRLASIEGEQRGSLLESSFRQQEFWVWLSVQLQRFAYASSLPSAASPDGSFGSLADQWSDLSERVPGLRVPEHRLAGSSTDALRGAVHLVDPRNLYSLGSLAPPELESVPSERVAYIRPAGRLFHVAQVGGMILVPNAPPQMSREQRDHVESFARSMAASSTARILEHAFFEGDGIPVFYSTCPVPVVTGRMPGYADLVVRGLQDDIERGNGCAIARNQLP